MAIAKKSYQQRLHKVFLTHNGLIHSFDNQIGEITLGCNNLVEFSDVDRITHKLIICIFGDMLNVFLCAAKLTI
ncbi:hypothetical protein IMSAGC006_02239 [Muribaculaceae bacterium]|nr:hypothetical protein IMSAGC006_02239 [Muribaculaceae bacterium]